MLVLSRRPGESVRIGSDVRVRVISVSGHQVRLALEAPDDVAIHREEVFERIVEANLDAARAAREQSALLEGAAERLGRGEGEG